MSKTNKKIKLFYFDTRGRGEALRVILHQAKVDFEDVRLTQEEWAKLKSGEVQNS